MSSKSEMKIASFFGPRQFLIGHLPMHTTKTRPFYNCFLFIVSGHKGRNRRWFTILIQCYIDHVAAGNVTDFAGDHVLRHDLYAHFHTGAAYVVHLTMDRHHVADICRGQKIKCLYSGRDHIRILAVLEGDNGSSLIHHTHNDATMHIPMCIRIYQFHEPPAGTPRGGYTATLCQIYFRKSLMSLCYFLEWVHSALILPAGYSTNLFTVC